MSAANLETPTKSGLTPAKHKYRVLVIAVTITTLAWVILLLIMGVGSSRSVIFYDFLAQQDVSDQYKSQLPANRLAIEPLVGLTFNFANKGLDWVLLFFIAYIIVRVGAFALDRTLLKFSPKKDILWNLFSDTLSFFLRYTLLLFGVILGCLVVCLAIFGFVFVANIIIPAVLVVVYGGLALFLARFVVNLVIYIRMHAFTPKYPRYLRRDSKKTVRHTKGNRLHRSMQVGRREFAYILGVFGLVLFLNFATLSTLYPTQEIQTDLAENEILFDFHVHTDRSDGWISPEERVRWYIAEGIQGAAISDHQNIHGAIAARNYVERLGLDFTVIIAQEFTCYNPDIHLNIYGIEEDLTPGEFAGDLYSPNALNVSDMIRWVKARGGYVTVNHYTSAPGRPYTYEALRDWGVDGFEIVNGGTEEGGGDVRQFCLDNDLICIAGTDEHQNEEIDTFVRLTLDDPNNRTTDAIFAALRKNTHQTVGVNKFGRHSPIPEVVDELDLNALYLYFQNMDVQQLVSWLIWTGVVYGLAIGFLLGLKKWTPEISSPGVIESNGNSSRED